MRFNHLKVTLLVFVLVIIQSCGDNQKESSFASSKSLYVDYISSYTSGFISKKSEIKLRLNRNIESVKPGENIEQDLFQFSPSIQGNAHWEDQRTIVFKPSSMLKSGKEYEVTFNLGKVVNDVPKDRQSFNFTFQTLIQNFDINVSGLALYSKSDLSKMKLTGNIQTADFAKNEEVEKLLVASQDGDALNITWDHERPNNRHAFVIENVKRKENQEEVSIKLDGKSIGTNKTLARTIEVPALNDYKIISSQIKRSDGGYISVMFSEPLDDKQNLTGLVKLSDQSGTPRVVINLNELKVYPSSTLYGQVYLNIKKSVKNSSGYSLTNDYSTKLQFSQIKPSVKLATNQSGAILPSSKGLILPFEAVGLKAVEVTIVRVFEENVLQYLQVNKLGGDSQLKRVARPVSKKTIPLNGVTDLNKWNKYTLDLAEVFSAEPGAVYQIIIGFSKRNSIFFCSDDGLSDLSDEIASEENWGPEEEASNWDGYENYYNSDYEWRDRDNPCSNSYYGRRRSVQKILFASNLGIIAKRGNNKKINAFVTNLLDTEPMEDISVAVYDYQQQTIGSGITNSNGMASIDISGRPFMLMAKKGDQVGYLKLDNGSSLSISNFNVGGKKLQKGIKGFIYGERGVWRPSDTVHLAFILENKNGNIPEKHPVVMEFWNPLGQIHSRKVSAQPVGDIYRFDMVTDSESPTGNWIAKAKVGGATFTKAIKVETVKPNRLKINLEFGKDKVTALDNSLSGDLNVRWLHGATAGGLKAIFEVFLTPIKTKFEKYPAYSFDDASRSFYGSSQTIFNGRLNSEGYAKINSSLDVDDNAPGALMAIFKGKVFEEGGDFSIDKFTLPYFPYTNWVGVKIPEGDKRGILLTDKKHQIRIATVDANGKPVSRDDVKVELFKLNWKWWWDNSEDNINNYIGRSYQDPIDEGIISTQNGEGSWEMEIKYPDWGRYYVRVTDPDGHSSGKVVYVDWPGWAGKAKKGDLGGANMLDFAVEKYEYKVGEDIKINVPSKKGNRILISLESGSKVIDAFWVKTEDKQTNVSFEATSDMAPNIYANITMVQPHGQGDNDLPIRLYGIQSLKVVDNSTVLSPILSMQDELRPEETFKVKIKEEKGKPMAYTVAVVDEGLLDLTKYTTPNPWGNFYAKEALGVKTWDIYDEVIGAYGGKIERLLTVGGDGELEEKDQKEANRFKPVVRYLGPYYLEPGETAEHSITMPQYVGSVKTMVVAAGNGAYGKTDKATPVRQPMMILATMPRVTGPGETITLPVNVFAMKDNIKQVDLDIKTTGPISVVGGSKQKVKFSKAGDKVAYFTLKVDQNIGIASVNVTAKTGKVTANYDVELNVIPRNPEVTDVLEKVISGSESWNVNYSQLGIAGTNEGTIELSAVPPLNIEQRLKYLVRYPHGCVEQTTSSVFAQLYLDKLLELDEGTKDRIQTNIDAAINRLKTFQTSDGGLAYWPGNSNSNLWGTNYAGHFLIEAKKKGYNVPDILLDNWKTFQKNQANSWNKSDNNNGLTQAYRLYTLALADEAQIGAMNRMKERSDLDIKAKWRLALAYTLAGYKSYADEIVKDISYTITNDNSRYNSYTYGSATRDNAMIMETLIELERKEDAFSILNKLSEIMGDSKKWMSTQTTAYCFIAISKYAEQFPVGEALNINATIAGASTDLQASDYVSQISIKDADQPTEIKLVNNGSAPIYARIIRKGIPLENTETSAEKNIRMAVKYMDMDGNPIQVDKIKQGTDFLAEVKVNNPGTKGNFEEVALTQIFPSGWEILNTRLDGTDSFYKEDPAEYKDIRDDRVLTYFDINANKELTYKVLLNAAYRGKYYLPAVSVEAMYDNTVYSRKSGRWVEVIGD